MTKPAAAINQNAQIDKTSVPKEQPISPKSREIVLGVVGYAGSGCSQVSTKLSDLLEAIDFECHVIKMSSLIADQFPERIPSSSEKQDGKSRMARVQVFQDLGDELREQHTAAVASLSVKEIIRRRGDKKPGTDKIAYIIDSLKHADEVHLLRTVYGESFHLIGVHCDRSQREGRLGGEKGLTQRKFSGVPRDELKKFLDRDEKDNERKFGQGVRDTFYLSDYFLDNNPDGLPDLPHLNNDLARLISLITGNGIVRPTSLERAMYHAFSASLQSACLSRQVGASVLTHDGRIIATGSNEAPKFGGGVYGEGDENDHRCYLWKFEQQDGSPFIGCHNTRKKNEFKKKAAKWFAENIAEKLAEAVMPPKEGALPRIDETLLQTTSAKIKKALIANEELFEKLPGVNDLIEYSRSIHAEMNAILNAARGGESTNGCILLCTTFPCHNCARHLVAAGISKVCYIEPYTKSLAVELHSDSIITEVPASWVKDPTLQDKMVVVPFSGAGPRMYEHHFTKRSEIKDSFTGEYRPLEAGEAINGVRLIDLERVEKTAADLVN
ncbi:anti-phage dCTP deaminase [Parvibaculum sp.]|uniref:anti-phage dCTP deaminase n=1 Tax=Parvibaculum sp. TaxID=2024848 RepID=UPI0027316049|nr:anti-phage dCTP deaminase [Parvibaculum sp.]MDP1626942.1 anti-phage dCTP deaminase [Parvibaculum sp.]MDP2151662.1 anti-phage dCTP deaminase [Parvibaculum sp.]MDP3328953.1 anti-phage dCTP deaminase [Parvibaculum sp.]